MLSRSLVASCFILLVGSSAFAKPYKEMFPDRTYKNQKAQEFVEQLDYQQGKVAVPAAGVTLDVPAGFYFVSAEDAAKILTTAWGNPPRAASGVLGMILPSQKSPIDETWGAVIRFQSDGYVSDEDADKINYSDLLKDMQSSTEEANEERTKAGFEKIKLIGWASPPYYDKTAHKLHWAKEIQFGDNPKHTLNYDVRALGRSGVLSMNFIASIEELDGIKRVIPNVMAIPQFDTGSRYSDFVPGVDKVAAYGIGGLIAGKVLAKTGLLVLGLAFLKKGWILVLLALGGVGKMLKGFISRKPRA